MSRFPKRPWSQRLTSEHWQHLLVVACGAGLAWVTKHWFWLLAALVLVAIPLLHEGLAAWNTHHWRYAPPLRGQIAALNASVLLVFLWGPLLWLDAESYELLRVRRWVQGHWEERIESPWRIFARPQPEWGVAEDGSPIHRVDVPPVIPASRTALVYEVGFREILSLPCLLWTLLLLNRMFRETIGLARLERVLILSVMFAVLSFLVAWRWVPWPEIEGPYWGVVETWGVITLLLGLFFAVPISDQV